MELCHDRGFHEGGRSQLIYCHDHASCLYVNPVLVTLEFFQTGSPLDQIILDLAEPYLVVSTTAPLIRETCHWAPRRSRYRFSSASWRTGRGRVAWLHAHVNENAIIEDATGYNWLAALIELSAAVIRYASPLSVGDKILSASSRLLNQARPQPVDEDPSEFYDWQTRSQFRPVKQDIHSKSVDDLCQAFPRHLLLDVQPVLKTGHGTLESRIRPQLRSAAACLDNLLIFSDVDEEFDGFQVLDVLADPSTNSSNEQLEGYFTQKRLADQGLLRAGNSANIKGWDLDKYKFLPGISRAWHMRPERRWYVFFEGDTYIVWDNMFRMLENFDPDLPWYYGSPSPGMGGAWMANGGPGFVLSREAVRRLVKGDFDANGIFTGSALAKRWENEIAGDCCGDSVLGWVIHEDAKTILSGMWPMFNPHALHDLPFSDLYWCQPVITMHRTPADDMMALWRWEQSRRDFTRPLLYADLADYLNMTEVPVRYDWENSDWDGYSADPDSPAHASFEACGQVCKADDNCFQWTYHHKSCTLVRSFRLGAAKAPALDNNEMDAWSSEDQRFTAGWDLEGIKRNGFTSEIDHFSEYSDTSNCEPKATILLDTSPLRLDYPPWHFVIRGEGLQTAAYDVVCCSCTKHSVLDITIGSCLPELLLDIFYICLEIYQKSPFGQPVEYRARLFHTTSHPVIATQWDSARSFFRSLKSSVKRSRGGSTQACRTDRESSRSSWIPSMIISLNHVGENKCAARGDTDTSTSPPCMTDGA
nr:glycoprotein-n-acetylgalactosamine 3-beta-galactosyltransferase 1-a [Quercus suber]